MQVTDPPGAMPELRPIPFLDCASYLNAKNISLQCPSCKSMDGAIITDMDKQVVSVFAAPMFVWGKKNELSVGSRWRPIFMTICNNCGALQHYNFDMLAKWLDGRENEGPNEQS